MCIRRQENCSGDKIVEKVGEGLFKIQCLGSNYRRGKINRQLNINDIRFNEVIALRSRRVEVSD